MDSRNFKLSRQGGLWWTAFLLLVAIQPALGEPSEFNTRIPKLPPAWATTSSWYQLSVPMFHNGSKSNDPPDTKPWIATCDPKNTKQSNPPENADSQHLFGGDLQGLQLRLNYLKRLGINALILTDVFSGTVGDFSRPADVKHIDDTLAIEHSLRELKHTIKETSDTLTKSDQLFVAFLYAAHRSGFRVVVDAPWPATDIIDAVHPSKRAANALAATRRWMDPNQDSDPSDGIDGWFFADRKVAGELALAGWYQEVKRINPDAIVISGDGDKFDERVCDVFIDYADLGTLARYRNLEAVSSRLYGKPSVGSKVVKHRFGRVSRLMPAHSTTEIIQADTATIFTYGKYVDESPTSASDRPRPLRGEHVWRLATVYQHLAGASPLVYFGDELGMHEARECGGMPMWWNDVATASGQPGEYSLDFYALTKLMNQLRSRFKALRMGRLRRVESPRLTRRDVLVFSRSLPDEKVIVILNLRNQTRTVSIPVGYPGQLVGVLSPQISPGRVSPFAGPPQTIGGQPVPQLGIGAQRRHADEWGDVTLQLKPETVKLIVIGGIDKQ